MREKNSHASELAKARWAKRTPEERSAIMSRVAAFPRGRKVRKYTRRKKREENPLTD